jgi:hypothetical protein
VEEKKLVCPNCECEIKEDDDFCPDCGTLFAEDVKCAAHEDKNAEGVCVICCEPFCKECGSFIDDVFFCEEDSDYKFSEGRVNLFESNDPEQMDVVKNILEEKGLHPYILSQTRGNKSFVLGADPTAMLMPGKYANDLSYLYLMIPFQEVIKAEEVLQELKLIE